MFLISFIIFKQKSHYLGNDSKHSYRNQDYFFYTSIYNVLRLNVTLMFFCSKLYIGVMILNKLNYKSLSNVSIQVYFSRSYVILFYISNCYSVKFLWHLSIFINLFFIMVVMFCCKKET